MGAAGTDILLSEQAHRLIPYSVECKNQEISKTVYDWYDQAIAQEAGQPLLVIKRNHREPLVVVDAEHFVGLLSRVTK